MKPSVSVFKGELRTGGFRPVVRSFSKVLVGFLNKLFFSASLIYNFSARF